ncbi:MarR family transcriptional regulator [Curtobacterium aetherium]|uniref:MarR family winged helix-turn-helix transcriptional regulator n=1 Tax=Curtobacterium aetherium TaxID=2841594 RepID=UPI003B52930E
MDADIDQVAEDLRAAVGDFVRAARPDEQRSDNQLSILGMLDREGPATIAALAARCRIRHQSATKVVEQLRAAQLVDIGAHPSDRRAVQVAISPTGGAALREERARRSAWIAEAIRTRLSEREQADVPALVAVLRQLTASR